MEMRVIGQLLMWIGFLGAALASVLRLEQPDKWSTIPWVGYAAAMSVGIVGVVLLRIVNRKEGSDSTQTDAEYSVLQRSLGTLSEVVGRLAGQTEHIPGEVLRQIDDRCADPFSDFAESRQALVKRFGLSVYADVMTEFASAERYVNRVWSAAADGYVDEVASSLRRANVHLGRARVDGRG